MHSQAAMCMQKGHGRILPANLSCKQAKAKRLSSSWLVVDFELQKECASTQQRKRFLACNAVHVSACALSGKDKGCAMLRAAHLVARCTKISYAEGRCAGASASMHASIRALTASGHSSGTRGERRCPRSGRSWHTSSCAAR